MPFVRATWRNSLRVKVLLAYVAGVDLSIAFMALVTMAVVTFQGDSLAGADVADRADDLARMLQYDDEGLPVGFDDSEGDLASWLYDSLRRETAYRVLDASGKVVLSSAAGALPWPSIGADRRDRPGRFGLEHDGVAMRGATVSVEHDGQVWFLQYAISRRFRELMYRFALPFTGSGITLFSVLLLLVF